MASAVTAFADSKGRLHPNLRQATLSDLAALFGNAEGMATGIAVTVLNERVKIEAILAAHDTLAAEAGIDLTATPSNL